MSIKIIDCTLRDGGYYNDWNFSVELIRDYLLAMQAISVDYVELGFRSLDSKGFKGGCAYTTDAFINTLQIPDKLKIAVMVNASELLNHSLGFTDAIKTLFAPSFQSKVTMVRIACHVHEFERILPVSIWLKEQGYEVAFNLMQIANRNEEEIATLASAVNIYPINVLYFADSMGSLEPESTSQVIRAFRRSWNGELGIHTHDNLNRALANSLRALDEGVNWVDCTVTGMGRGPGNVKTEFLVMELQSRRSNPVNITSLLSTIRKHFYPLQNQYKWGSNPYYFLSGKYAIHPTYIQQMLADNRYNEEDILAVIEYLKSEGGNKFNLSTLEAARHFFRGEPIGSWKSSEKIKDREVLILGTGPGVEAHKVALEAYIIRKMPFVIALNSKKSLDESLINIRVACHPVRLLADCHEYIHLPQPLVIPASMLPDRILSSLTNKEILDFGLTIHPNKFEFHETYAIIPSSLVFAYALALTTSGEAKRILLAGFDGYGAEDPRNKETDQIFEIYKKAPGSIPLLAITPSRYEIECSSVYALLT